MAEEEQSALPASQALSALSLRRFGHDKTTLRAAAGEEGGRGPFMEGEDLELVHGILMGKAPRRAMATTGQKRTRSCVSRTPPAVDFPGGHTLPSPEDSFQSFFLSRTWPRRRTCRVRLQEEEEEKEGKEGEGGTGNYSRLAFCLSPLL